MMFETMVDRAGRRARERVEARRREMAEALAAELPPGIRAEASDEGVRLSGRGLSRRFALDARLKGLVAGLAR